MPRETENTYRPGASGTPVLACPFHVERRVKCVLPSTAAGSSSYRLAHLRLGHGPMPAHRECAVPASAGLAIPDSKLGGVKQVVQALPAHELVMRTGIDDAAMVHDQDAVRFPDCRQPVCNDKHRPVLAE